jgi:hypothetical protein
MEPAFALEAGDPTIAPSRLPLFGRERMRTFVLANFDSFARLNQPLPALSQDSVNFVSQSNRLELVTKILESFNGLFPGIGDPDTDNIIEITDADDLSRHVAKIVMPFRPDMAKTITDGIADGTLCWSGKIPTTEKEVPMVLVSEQASPPDLSKCLYRGVMTHMGVTILYKDRYPMEGRLNAILSHMANITAMHIFFECRQHIRALDFVQARGCVSQRLDELY